MKVVFTKKALADLENLISYSREHWPRSVPRIEARLQGTIQRIGTWPESSQRVEPRPNVRVVPLRPFPYKLFYEVRDDAVTILHIHHAARRDPWEI